MTADVSTFALKTALKLDHLVIAARTLDEGAQFVAAKFGVETQPGGAHLLMRTHNRLLNLWGGVYLEVIAVDPATAPIEHPRPRLFVLDDPGMQPSHRGTRSATRALGRARGASEVAGALARAVSAAHRAGRGDVARSSRRFPPRCCSRGTAKSGRPGRK